MYTEHKDLTTHVGDKIRRIRVLRGLSQAQLGEVCGISSSHVHVKENARISVTLRTLEKVVLGLDLDIHELFGPDEPIR